MDHAPLHRRRGKPLRLTALDIQNHQFAQAWRGLDSADVQTFLRLVAEDFEQLVRESDGLREKVRLLEGRIENLSSNEHALRETLVTAQALSEDLKRTAVKGGRARTTLGGGKGEGRVVPSTPSVPRRRQAARPAAR